MRPDLQAAYDLLCYQGEQFAEPHDTEQIDTVQFLHPKDGKQPIAIDWEVLAAQGSVYTSEQELRDVLSRRNIVTEDWSAATTLLAQNLEAEKLVWGFSGYATGGFNKSTGDPFSYKHEAEGLDILYEYLGSANELPHLVVDGGVSEGFLALSAIVSQNQGVPTLGFIPKQGLASIGTRDHLVIAGDTYQDREALVGTADLLVCAGGEKGTIRECLTAIRHGSAVLMLALKKYPSESLPNTYYKYDELRTAVDEGSLVICQSLDEIPEGIERVLSFDVKASRPRRIEAINQFKP